MGPESVFCLTLPQFVALLDGLPTKEELDEMEGWKPFNFAEVDRLAKEMKAKANGI